MKGDQPSCEGETTLKMVILLLNEFDNAKNRKYLKNPIYEHYYVLHHKMYNLTHMGLHPTSDSTMYDNGQHMRQTRKAKCINQKPLLHTH